MRSRKLPLLASLLIIFLSTLFVSGSATAGWIYYRRWQQQRCRDPHYVVKRIQQHSSLPSDFLAQTMGLRPGYNLYAIDTDLLRARLVASPLITAANVHRDLPDTLVVELEATPPLARLAEFPQFGIDAAGNTLPLTFYNGATLPEIYLGTESPHELPEQQLQAALALLSTELTLQRVDTSQVLAESAGRRQIVATVGLPPNQHILRMHPRRTDEAFSKYQRLQPREGNLVIDLRLRQLAFISEETP